MYMEVEYRRVWSRALSALSALSALNKIKEIKNKTRADSNTRPPARDVGHDRLHKWWT